MGAERASQALSTPPPPPRPAPVPVAPSGPAPCRPPRPLRPRPACPGSGPFARACPSRPTTCGWERGACAHRRPRSDARERGARHGDEGPAGATGKREARRARGGGLFDCGRNSTRGLCPRTGAIGDTLNRLLRTAARCRGHPSARVHPGPRTRWPSLRQDPSQFERRGFR